MSRLNKADEIIELAILMQNSFCGLTVEDIAEHFECSYRSASRMKSLLFEKFPEKFEEVENTTDRKKRWRFKKGTMNFLINFNSTEFALLEKCKNNSKNSTEQKEMTELIEKIKALNPKDAHTTDINELLETQGYAVRQQYKENINPKFLDIIREAILSQKKIIINYNNYKNIVYPYGILVSEKQYLVAFNEYYKEILMYRISKIKDIKITEDYFEKDEKFDLKSFAQFSFGVFQGEKLDVKLEFDKSARDDVLEYNFHPTQKFAEIENGNILVEFVASGSFEIITELLKWRDCVKIISPESLKQEYNDTVEKMVKNLK